MEKFRLEQKVYFKGQCLEGTHLQRGEGSCVGDQRSSSGSNTEILIFQSNPEAFILSGLMGHSIRDSIS